MYLKEGEWKLYDIAIDGISLVNNYRSSFGSQIRRNPDGLNSLINKLASHNQQAQK
jgi:phospholipid transport system substrate-binding protein